MKKVLVFVAIFALTASACMGPPNGSEHSRLIGQRERAAQKLTELVELIDWVQTEREENGKEELYALARFVEDNRYYLKHFDAVHGGFCYGRDILESLTRLVNALEENDEPVLANLSEHVWEKIEDVL